MRDIALKLERKGEQAFAQQNYGAAIANAKAALEVKPGDARATTLLHEAEKAQRRAP
jgi:Meckel syndrome type 1 protein